MHLDREDDRKGIVGGRREGAVLDGLHHVFEEDPSAQRVPVRDDGLVAGVACRDVFATVPAVELDAPAPALQYERVLLRCAVALQLMACEVGVVAGV